MRTLYADFPLFTACPGIAVTVLETENRRHARGQDAGGQGMMGQGTGGQGMRGQGMRGQGTGGQGMRGQGTGGQGMRNKEQEDKE